MEQRAHIYLLDKQSGNRREALLRRAGGQEKIAWFEDPAGQLADHNDAGPFLLASMLTWMQDGAAVHVHGTLSSQLLDNLDELQRIWQRWRPDKYRRVIITADAVQDATSRKAPAVAAFSGGVDATYTVLRHRTDLAGRASLPLEAALLVHGFDIELANSEAFSRAEKRARLLLQDTGIEVLTMRTNIRHLFDQEWEDGFSLAVGACLSMLSSRFGYGLIGSSEPYEQLALPWGSTPLTDRLASSDNMQIVHDGADASRGEKVAAIANWPEAAEHVRVCWQGEDLGINCGRCEKCVRTLLNFKLAGIEHPSSFAHTRLTSWVPISNQAVAAEWKSIELSARASKRPDLARYARANLALRHIREALFSIGPLRRLARARKKRTSSSGIAGSRSAK